MLEKIDIQKNDISIQQLLARVEAGEEIIITRTNQPIVQLMPLTAPRIQRRIGEAKGLIKIAPDFDEMPEDWMEYFK